MSDLDGAFAEMDPRQRRLGDFDVRLARQDPQAGEDRDQGRQTPAFGHDLAALDLEKMTMVHAVDLR
ncbi:hypothetical protein E1H18_1770 [Caulobacter sp. RHG1]|nr:hypothetical protein [Caulobacter sp. RHG1]